MKLSLSWLKEYLDLNLSPEKIGDSLTLAGLEVEGMEKVDHDIIFEIGLTPNLGHCMSVIGIARELSAILNIPLKRKKIAFNEHPKDKIEDYINVKIEDPSQCLRYSCRLVKHIQVGPSPDWLKEKLENSGIRSINNVVDIGNLVMLECGQPLHLFDYDKLSGQTIFVKSAKVEIKLATLDGKERIAQEGTLLICDEKEPIAFAGVIGDLRSSVSNSTTNVLIESAHFTPEAVRKTSKLLNLRTDSSIRFERGIDPLSVASSLDFAAQLLENLASGKICKGSICLVVKKHEPSILHLNPFRANKLLGTKLSIREMITLLERLEIKLLSESADGIEVQVPSYRNDLKAEIDLVEEIGRMYGFNSIPRHLPKHTSSTITHAPLFLFEQEIRAKLVAQGLQECLTCDLISPKLAKITLEKALNNECLIHVLHPASIDQSILRTTLLPGLLEVVKFNLDRQILTMNAFEVGHIHFKEGENFFGEPAAGIILTGLESPYHFENKPNTVNFFDLKGHVENLLASIGIKIHAVEPSHLQNFHPGRQCRVKVGDIAVGVIGEVHPSHLRDLGIFQKVYYAELNLHDLLNLKSDDFSITKISTFPGSERDWTITLPENTPIGKILDEIKSFPSSILEDVFLLDLYKNEKREQGKKKATFRFQYRDLNKTIEFQEVDKEHKKLTQLIEKKLNI